jgi:hypothetical protein
MTVEQELEFANGCLDMVREVLVGVHGEESMAATPPMMYAEAIRSALYKAHSGKWGECADEDCALCFFRSEQDMLTALEDAVNAAGGTPKFAEQVGVTANYARQVLRGHRPASDKLLDVIEYERSTRYRKKGKK